VKAARRDGHPVTIKVDFDVPARMRDGVILRADVYRPEGEGPWPTLLVRTPYGKGVLSEMQWNGVSPVEASRRGFMVVIQDTRGRFASEGEWEPLRFEAQDGADTVAWAARLSGSSGRVGMFGGSYCGSTQWLAAIEAPAALAAIAPLMTWCEPMDGLFARGGALELGLVLPWSLIQGFDYLGRLGSREDAAGRAATLAEDIDGLTADGYWQLPVNSLPLMERNALPELGSIRALSDPLVAERTRVANAHDRVLVPSLHTAGWYDVFLQGTLDNYTAMAGLGREAQLIVGPWAHERFLDPIGDRTFGIAAMREAPIHDHGDWADEVLAFHRRHLIPDEEGKPGPPVRLFVMGRNEWRDEASWPLERVEVQNWYLRSDGSLAPQPPAAADRPNEIVYDPADPVPTHGGQLLMAPAYVPGPLDQAAIEARHDVLVFTSTPLEEDLEVTGRIRAVLDVESSAPSTDWVARLCDVDAGGRSFNLCDGIVRLRSGANTRQRIHIDLWSTSNVFLAGHRVRLQVTNSCFPRWDRNLNTGDQRDTRFVVAHQRLYHDSEHPSYVELPVVVPHHAIHAGGES
jgi:uncharacterized protein